MIKSNKDKGKIKQRDPVDESFVSPSDTVDESSEESFPASDAPAWAGSDRIEKYHPKKDKSKK